MGRSEEPQLEELSKLLRRLETMEVAPKHDRSHKAEAEKPQTEYVGALRGAPHGPTEERHGDSGYARAASHRQDTASRSGNSAIVIGATTAAVVSSVVAVGLILLTSGGQKGEGERRLTFYAPTGQGTTAPPARAANPVREAPSEVQPLMQRADYALRNGNPDEARVALEQAAQLGSGVAALTLGAMYDPGRVGQFTNLALTADKNVARAWYERARNLGVDEANARLAELAAR